MAIIESLQKISDTVWELPATYKQGMRVPARIVATEKLVREMDEAVYQQISNVATLPGIARYAGRFVLESERETRCSIRTSKQCAAPQGCVLVLFNILLIKESDEALGSDDSWALESFSA
jgi:hypothetical protein